MAARTPPAEAVPSPPPSAAAHAEPRVFILPAPARPSGLAVVTLPHPATQAPTRYLLDAAAGLHEIRKLAYPVAAPRSWLAVPAVQQQQQAAPGAGWLGAGQALPASALYLCTPLDPLFLLLPHLLAAASRHFLPLDDILDPLLAAPGPFHWRKLLHPPGCATDMLVRARISAVCDAVDAGAETGYRLSHSKLLGVLAKKCLRIAARGLPRSAEDEFVRRALALPIGAGTRPPASTTQTEGEETATQEPTAATGPPPPIVHLHRLSLSLSLLAPYLPPALPPLLEAHLAALHDPAPLTAYLSTLSALKSDLSFTRAGDYSLAPGGGGDLAEGSRRRKRAEAEGDEEKKRKKNVSGAVRKLAKADTKGMMKMTSFFKKQGAAAAGAMRQSG
ncbi:ribonuclease H2, subunit B [Tirmania nivea]|nr:ribonuclease H2, subunit B [Tirmania nivea]